MKHIISSPLFLLLCHCLSCKSYITSDPLHNAFVTSKSAVGGMERTDTVFHTKDFSWARGNQSCLQLRNQCLKYFEILPLLSAQYVVPALALTLMQVGCLSETDPFLSVFLIKKDSKKLFRELSAQWKTNVHHSFTHPNNVKKRLDIDILRFNLDSLSPSFLLNCTHSCSSSWLEKQGVHLNGVNFGEYRSLQDAKLYCNSVGLACAGVALDKAGVFQTVLKSGGFIAPQMGSRLWLQHCYCGKIRRRSVTPECQNENEQQIHKVVQWLPLVSGWYNAGSAIYYATKGCGEQAEDRVVEASLDLGYDALLAVTAGASGGTGLALGAILKPAVKAGMRAAIGYIKQSPQQEQVTQEYPQSPIIKGQ